jgi:acyl-CoA reductase-like NAD-dependent aldehyde dehydrogenase
MRVQNFIDGHWIAAHTGQVFSSINPANEELVAEVAQSDVRDINSGIVYINHGTTGAEIQFPFGGTRGTGNGHREAGQVGIDVFTEWKAIYVDYSGKLQRAQIDQS